jgi:hypothetical protein
MTILHFVFAPLTAAVVYILVAFLIMLPKLIQNPDYAHPFVAAWLAGGLGYLPFAAVVGLCAALSVTIGIGLWRQREWGRRLALTLAAIGALTFSNGTVWAIRYFLRHDRDPTLAWWLPPLIWYGWVLWYLTRKEVAEAFRAQQKSPPPQA